MYRTIGPCIKAVHTSRPLKGVPHAKVHSSGTDVVSADVFFPTSNDGDPVRSGT